MVNIHSVDLAGFFLIVHLFYENCVLARNGLSDKSCVLAHFSVIKRVPVHSKQADVYTTSICSNRKYSISIRESSHQRSYFC